MISIRLDEDEYQALLRVCDASGIHSLSSFARRAMQLQLDGVSSKGAECNYMQELEIRLSELNQKIDELLKIVMPSNAELNN